jgi:hypothetical protein
MIMVRKGNPQIDGSCNACTFSAGEYTKVWVITMVSPISLQIRLCPQCMKELREKTK